MSITHAQAEALIGVRLESGWRFVPVQRAGCCAGFFMVRGSEVHAWRDPSFEGRWLEQGDLRALVAPILAAHGCVTTKVRKINAVGHRFVTRMGFEKTGEVGDVALYAARSIKHARL